MKITAGNNVFNSQRKFSPLALALALFFSTLAQAAPVGGVVTSGGATISNTGGNTTINQSTPKTIINWQGFNVGASESVNFIQPNTSSIALNRVTSPNATMILGNISANGRIFLINPNGIVFGAGSQVNVGGMVASTLGITDANFLSGNYRFAGNSSAAILNQGTINTNLDGGYIALLGANVSNTGIIVARLGTVALAAGNGITLDVAGDHLLNVGVNEGAVNALVSNGHLIIADGGQVLMTARGASSLLANAVNNTGLIQAQSIENKNGSIILSAGPDAGVVNLSGTLDASGLNSGQTGGTIELLGGTVSLANATINASGNAGGGTVLVGGNFNGAGPQPNALYTNIDGTSTINADAIASGNGGKIAVWSNNTTYMAGTLTARGGALSGDGGFIETSGKYLTIADSAIISTLATKGHTGTWLLDPLNYTISGTGGDTTGALLGGLLNSNDVIIPADNDIFVNDVITWTAPTSLTLIAGHDVQILAGATITGSTAGAQVIIIAGNDVSNAGTITSSGSGNQIKITATAGKITSTGTITSSAALTNTVSMTAGSNLFVQTLTSGGDANLTAGNNITVGAVNPDGSITGGAIVAGGTARLIAGNSGNGAGSVSLNGVGAAKAITAPNTEIRFNPASYATTSTEVASYTAKTSSSSPDIRAWVFLQGNDKIYNQTTAATLSLKAPPTGVTLSSGTAIFGNENAGVDKAITYTSYSLVGAGTTYALYSTSTTPGAGTTKATISPASLVVSATGTNKVFDGTTTDTVTLSATPLSGDSVLPGTYTSANFANTAVGVNKPVTVLGITLTGADAGNYSYNTTATTTASITSGGITGGTSNPASSVNGLVVVPIIPPGGSSQAPMALQEDIGNGVSSPTITPYAGAGIVSGSLLAMQSSNQSNLLIVTDPPKAAELQSLFPDPIIAPYRIPKQGRN